MAIELKTKQGHISLTAPKVIEGGSVDLGNYYTKAQTDKKIEEAVANVQVDLTGYATEQYVNDFVGDIAVEITNSINKNTKENYVTKEDFETVTSAFLTDIPDEYLTDSEAEEKYARITDIPDVSEFITEIPNEYVTESELSSKGYVNATYVQTAITENAPDTSNFATKSEIPDVSGYQTEEQVNTLISNALAEIGVAEQGAY